MMSRNGQALITAIPLPPDSVFTTHAHELHQVIWSQAGIIEVSVESALWVLPPSRALWMPSGTFHQTRGRDAARELGGAFIKPGKRSPAWKAPCVLEMTPLLRALLGHLGQQLDDAARTRAEALIPDALRPIDATPIRLSVPRDDRGEAVARALLQDPSDGRSLIAFGKAAGASQRTLSRIFISETGVSFNRWRTTLRVRAALPHLAAGVPVAEVASLVGYQTPSAFVAAFRRVTGGTPGAYFSTPVRN